MFRRIKITFNCNTQNTAYTILIHTMTFLMLQGLCYALFSSSNQQYASTCDLKPAVYYNYMKWSAMVGRFSQTLHLCIFVYWISDASNSFWVPWWLTYQGSTVCILVTSCSLSPLQNQLHYVFRLHHKVPNDHHHCLWLGHWTINYEGPAVEKLLQVILSFSHTLWLHIDRCLMSHNLFTATNDNCCKWPCE